MRLRGLLIAILALSAVWARDWPQMRDEADKGLPPWIQYYNRLKGEPKLGPLDQHLSEPESLNVRLVGKWGRGPAARVTGRDTLVYLALGSEVAIFNCANAHNPIIVNEIQCRYVVDRPILRDSILYCVLQGGVEVFNVANPASPTRIKYLSITAVDMCIDDTMAYTIDADSFKAYRIVAPDSFERLGACADSGYYIAADSGFAYLCDRWGLYVMDATDPANPHQATVLTGADVRAVLVDSGYCYYTTANPSPNTFRIADVSDPYHPAEVGYIDGIASNDLFKLSYFVYLPQYHIVDVSTPSFPTVVGSLDYSTNSVWTRSPFSYSFMAADYNGFATVTIADPVHPALDTVMGGAHEAWDISLVGAIACVADNYAGMKVLDVGSPSSPTQVGSYDSAGYDPEAQAVATRDTLAYLMAGIWSPTGFRVLSLADPQSPMLLGMAGVFNPAKAVTLRDSLAYVAEDSRFQIFSVANPRNPRLVGSCQALDMVGGLCVQGNLAYEESGLGLGILDISDPVNPRLMSTTPGHPTNSWGIAVRDSLAFIPSAYDTLWVYDVANPSSPIAVAHTYLGNAHGYDVALDGNRAYVGCCDLRVFDISDPFLPVMLGYYTTPGRVRRVAVSDGLVYAACFEGGICVFDTLQTGISEEHSHQDKSSGLRLLCWPSPVHSIARVEVEGVNGTRGRLRVFDLSGRAVKVVLANREKGGRYSTSLDGSSLISGVYFLVWESSSQRAMAKILKQ